MQNSVLRSAIDVYNPRDISFVNLHYATRSKLLDKRRKYQLVVAMYKAVYNNNVVLKQNVSNLRMFDGLVVQLEHPNTIKGKLAHNFMLYYLMLISCLSDLVSTYIMEENAKINICCSYREKKIKFGNSESLGFPISPCATSLQGEFPRNRKGFLCVMIQCMLNQIIKKSNVS